MTDAVDRSIDSPIADSASSARGYEKRQFELHRGITGFGGATCCAQCSAGRIPVDPDGFGAGDRGDFAAGDFAAGEGVFSGVLSVILGGSEVPAEMERAV